MDENTPARNIERPQPRPRYKNAPGSTSTPEDTRTAAEALISMGSTAAQPLMDMSNSEQIELEPSLANQGADDSDYNLNDDGAKVSDEEEDESENQGDTEASEVEDIDIDGKSGSCLPRTRY